MGEVAVSSKPSEPDGRLVEEEARGRGGGGGKQEFRALLADSGTESADKANVVHVFYAARVAERRAGQAQPLCMLPPVKPSFSSSPT